MDLTPDVAAVPVTVSTDAGMLALWSPAAFSHVIDYDTWEPELLEDEDQLRHIRAGALVPINIHSDGAFGVVARTGTASEPVELTEREAAYLVVPSEPFLFRSHGVACLSGVEGIGGTPWPGTVQLELPVGEYAVVVHLIDWTEEPGSTVDGEPSPTALADFAVLINPVSPGEGPFRQQSETFERRA